MIERHIFAFVCGLIAGIIPNNKSNIYPPLLGVIFAILFSKIVFGDYDRGYQWTFSDILFVLIVGAEGAIGAWISNVVTYFLRKPLLS
jgi:hypothetical protein